MINFHQQYNSLFDILPNKTSHIDTSILDRLKQAAGITKDKDLANYLGINPTTLANWRSRDTLNLKLIVSECDEIDLNWLIKGERSHYEMYVQEPTSEYVSDRREKEVTELIEKVNQGSWSPDTKIALISQIIEAAQEPTKPNHNKPK